MRANFRRKLHRIRRISFSKLWSHVSPEKGIETNDPSERKKLC